MLTSDRSANTTTVSLRPYQVAAVERLHERIRAGARRVILVAATGAGKTTIAGHIIASSMPQGSRVLFIAHRRELINQAYRRLVEFGLAEDQVGILMAGDSRRRPAAPVQVASVDTLRNRPKPAADLVFIDECHRALSPSYRDIAAHYPNAVHLGLTATPYRADGKGLGDAYDELLLVASPRQLINEGYLVEPRVFTVPPTALPDLTGVRVKGGDYDEAALARAVDRAPLVGNIVEHWLKHAHGIRTVVFAVSVAHSKHIVDRFKQAGVAAEHLDGMTPTPERDAILARLESGETVVIGSVGCLSEGWDQPSVKCAILARPTKSTGLYLQQAGRILRPWQNTQAIILDHGGCAQDHGLPQDDRELSLAAPKKKRMRSGASTSPVKTCPDCYAVLSPATRVCSGCGAELIHDNGVPKEADGALIEVTPSADSEQRAEWERLCAVAAARGHKPGWAYHRFREKFGTKPPMVFGAAPSAQSQAKRALFDTLRNGETSDAWAALRYRIEVGEAAPKKWLS
jgi:superfamily II DNA or RNA helicase